MGCPGFKNVHELYLAISRERRPKFFVVDRYGFSGPKLTGNYMIRLNCEKWHRFQRIALVYMLLKKGKSKERQRTYFWFFKMKYIRGVEKYRTSSVDSYCEHWAQQRGVQNTTQHLLFSVHSILQYYIPCSTRMS